MEFQFDARHAIVACAFITVILIVLVARQGMRSYQSAFVATVAAGLKQNFIVGNPQALFAISIMLTAVLGTIAYMTIGPIGAVAAAILAIAGPRLTVAYLANKRTKRLVSVSRPNAFTWFTYCAMFPGKIAMKNAAVMSPTGMRKRGRNIRDRPNTISSTPEAITTKSVLNGRNIGTCATNSCRANVRWLMPA